MTLRWYKRTQHAYDHRSVAESILGKPLPPRAQIHHVDGNPLNNTPRNLVICEDFAYHKLLHRRTRIVKAGGNPNTDAICGKCLQVQPVSAFNRRGSTNRHGYCRTCAAEYWQMWKGRQRADSSAE